MGEHPRSLPSGLVPCSNCRARLPAHASYCPECQYPWPGAIDLNRVICPKCERSVPIYVRVQDSRINEWIKAQACIYCCEPDPWRGQSIEARAEPPPSLEDRITAIAILMTVAVIVYLVLA